MNVQPRQPGNRILARAAVIALAGLALHLRAAGDSPLQLVTTVPLPGVAGRIDHFSLDAAGGRLFLAALGNNTVEVIDLARGRVAHTIAGLAEPQGIAYVRASNRLVVAGGGDGAVRIFDGTTLAPLAKISLDDDADNVRYDSTANEVYVGYGAGGLAVVDAERGVLADRIPLPAHPESFQLEKTGPRIFVNVPDAGQIAVVDRAERKVVATWPMAEFQANFPMALDEPHHRLFVGCRRPARLVVLDTESGRPVGDVDLAGDCDDLFYDAARRRLYASCGEGFLDVFAPRDAGHYERIAHLPTAPGARTSFFSPELGRLFLAVPARPGREAELRIFAVR